MPQPSGSLQHRDTRRGVPLRQAPHIATDTEGFTLDTTAHTETAARPVAPPRPSSWDDLPAQQQPQWRDHPNLADTLRRLSLAPPLSTVAEIAQLRRSLSEVAAGRASMVQIGDCAEPLTECGRAHVSPKLRVLEQLGDELARDTATPVVRVGRIGGQFAKPRSSPTEEVDGVELPTFRGHLVNSEERTRGSRRHDPRRMLWGYRASAESLRCLRWWRALHGTGLGAGHRASGGDRLGVGGQGPWASHEALVIDYESSLLRNDPDSGAPYLASTHLPWVGERTRQPDHAHVRLLGSVLNPVGCKLGPSVTPEEVVRLCELLDPARVPGRLVLIPRMGKDGIARALPPVVEAVRRAGHPVVWLCDPMHGNTVSTEGGRKTRYLEDVRAEARRFREIVAAAGAHPGGLHMEVGVGGITECIGGAIESESALDARYTTLCDPRLEPEQARAVVADWGGRNHGRRRARSRGRVMSEARSRQHGAGDERRSGATTTGDRT